MELRIDLGKKGADRGQGLVEGIHDAAHRDAGFVEGLDEVWTERRQIAHHGFEFLVDGREAVGDQLSQPALRRSGQARRHLGQFPEHGSERIGHVVRDEHGRSVDGSAQGLIDPRLQRRRLQGLDPEHRLRVADERLLQVLVLHQIADGLGHLGVGLGLQPGSGREEGLDRIELGVPHLHQGRQGGADPLGELGEVDLDADGGAEVGIRHLGARELGVQGRGSSLHDLAQLQSVFAVDTGRDAHVDSHVDSLRGQAQGVGDGDLDLQLYRPVKGEPDALKVGLLGPSPHRG